MHRAGTSIPHFAEGHARHFGDSIPGENRRAPLRHGLENVELVLTLEGRGRRRIYDAHAMLRGEDDHRNAFVARGDHAGQQIGGAGTGIAEDDGDLAGGLVQSFGHVNGGGLMANRNESDTVVVELGEYGIDFGARKSEHELDALSDETFQEKLGTSDFAHGIILRRGIGHRGYEAIGSTVWWWP